MENRGDDIGYTSWPFREAERLFGEIGGRTPKKGYVLFCTGYSPSGLPHIGTFAEIVRTNMVIDAFKKLYPDIKVRLYCISDDFDGLRKIPDTIPNKDDYIGYLGLPLTKIPDPFGNEESYGHAMNLKMRSFLDRF